MAKSLEGDYREEHLFALQQSLAGYRFCQTLIAEVDVKLESKTHELPRAAGAPEQMPPRTKEWVYQRAGNEPTFDLRSEMFRIAGVDLTDVPGISSLTAYTILMEVGPDVSRFRNASAFASWLGLCPENRSAEERSCTPDLARLRTELPSHCGLVLIASTGPKTISESSTVA